ncbi:hypothetical protein FRC03_001404 [Tulasnella sp. 419]|nr:hypothetical protein FRC03_001404 [Tulasnella sp. 419]
MTSIQVVSATAGPESRCVARDRSFEAFIAPQSTAVDPNSNPQALGGPSSPLGPTDLHILLHSDQAVVTASPPTYTPAAGLLHQPSEVTEPLYNTIVSRVGPPPLPPRPWRRPPIRRRIRFFFSSQNHEARRRIANVARVCIETFEVVTIVVLSMFSARKWKSKSHTNLSEWEACSNPVGIWNVLWAGRVTLAIGLGIWEIMRDQRRDRESNNDLSRQTDLESASRQHHVVPARPHDHGGAQPTIRNSTHPRSSGPQQPQNSNIMFNRLETFVTALALGHFVVNHILLYGSLQSCRFESPHVWWLGFGILCLGYLIVAEILLIAFIVFILGPLILFTLNVIMLCLGWGRPLDAQGNLMIKHEIPKMSKHEVDQIPQVIYIPLPPSSDPAEPASSSPEYPPKPHGPISGAEASAEHSTGEAVQLERAVGTRIKNAFKIFQRKKPAERTDIEATPERISEDHSSEDPWEAQFEKGVYPFIRLEQNRAACAICLVDYVPPRRRDANPVSGAMTSTSSTNNEHPETPDSNNYDENNEEEQTGKPGEPLRHLPCGHVFHTHCVDEWLLNTSGRCPTCQGKVET